LKAAYGVFQEEARDVAPGYTPTTVNIELTRPFREAEMLRNREKTG
jgi:hypothetical protein